MEHILVTGGFGFIGSHLVETLISEPDNHIHVVDDLSSSPINYKDFLGYLGNPINLTYNITTVDQYCKEWSGEQRFSQIYHLASIVGPVGVLSHAGQIAQQIINDTRHIINFALHHKARILDVSTSEVYGGGRDGYCSEADFKVVQPKATVRLEYAMGKLAAEIALINTTRVTELWASIIRPFNVAGPRQSGKGGFVLPRFIDQALKGEPLTVYNDGKMIRAFTHVKDIVEGLSLGMKYGRRGEAYNLGNPANKISIIELAERVINLTKSKSKITFVDPKTIFGPLFEEANDKYPDADLAMREFGWKPAYGIDETILITFDYIRAGRQD